MAMKHKMKQPFNFYCKRMFASNSKQASLQHAEHCMDLVRSQDYDYWLMGLLMPSSARPGFYAVRAFNIETSSIIDTVRGNVIPGKMRFQWWKDVIHEMYNSGVAPSGHPVASFLEGAIHRHGLSRRWFDRILEARWRELEEEQPLTVAELERNCDHNNASLILLTLECLGYGPGEELNNQDESEYENVGMDLAAQHLGKAVGICNYLRGTSIHASKGRLYIPVEILRKHDGDARYLMNGPTDEGLEQNIEHHHHPSSVGIKHAVKDMAERAENHLIIARSLYEGKASNQSLHDFNVHDIDNLKPAPSGARYAFLPAIRAHLYLKSLKQYDYNLHHPTLWNLNFEDSLIKFQLKTVGSSFGIVSPFQN